MREATPPRRRPRHLLVALGAVGLLAALAPAPAQDGPGAAPLRAPVRPGPAVDGGAVFKGAKELSGIACRPRRGGPALDCLVVSDEATVAQRLVVESAKLRPGATVRLIGDSQPTDARGSRPVVEACPRGEGEFGEFDGEGVAFAAASPEGDGAFYVVGSHGCSRNKGEFRPSSFLLARVRASRDGSLAPAELTWRLSDALRAKPPLDAHFGRSLGPDGQGLNVEGVAASGGRLLFGLRAPSRDGKAFIVGASIEGLFAPGSGAAAVEPTVIPVALGPETGIRDMAPLPDGRLLVLSGPTREQKDVPFAVALVALDEAAGTSSVRWLARLGDVDDGDGERAKAEAMAVLGREGDALRLLVLFDGIGNGGPREYRVRLPR